MKQEKFLSGTSHGWSTKEEASKRAGPLDEVKREDDGSWSVYRMSSRQIYRGQKPWVGSSRK